jgi:hypothetical protein
MTFTVVVKQVLVIVILVVINVAPGVVVFTRIRVVVVEWYSCYYRWVFWVQVPAKSSSHVEILCLSLTAVEINLLKVLLSKVPPVGNYLWIT